MFSRIYKAEEWERFTLSKNQMRKDKGKKEKAHMLGEH
jgi:hypothetical protein